MYYIHIVCQCCTWHKTCLVGCCAKIFTCDYRTRELVTTNATILDGRSYGCPLKAARLAYLWGANRSGVPPWDLGWKVSRNWVILFAYRPLPKKGFSKWFLSRVFLSDGPTFQTFSPRFQTMHLQNFPKVFHRVILARNVCALHQPSMVGLSASRSSRCTVVSATYCTATHGGRPVGSGGRSETCPCNTGRGGWWPPRKLVVDGWCLEEFSMGKVSFSMSFFCPWYTMKFMSCTYTDCVNRMLGWETVPTDWFSITQLIKRIKPIPENHPSSTCIFGWFWVWTPKFTSMNQNSTSLNPHVSSTCILWYRRSEILTVLVAMPPSLVKGRWNSWWNPDVF